MIGAAVLVLALGATAQVPHWVQKKHSEKALHAFPSKIANMKSKIMKNMQSGRRLDAHIPAGCLEACPGITDMEAAMAEEGRRLEGHDAMMKMCPYMDTVKCMAEADACKDPESEEVGGDDDDEEGMAMMECMCACPKIAEVGEDMSVACNDKPGTVGCIAGESACAALAKDLDMTEFNLGCEYLDKDCQEKAEKSGDCLGAEWATSWGAAKCGEEKGYITPDEAADCCPLGAKMVECMTPICYSIQMAQLKVSDEDGAEDSLEEMKKSRENCPDAGLPSDAEVDAAVASADPAQTPAAASFAARGQTVSMLALAAAMAAWMMA